MEDLESVRKIIQAQSVVCDDKYTLDKAYWQRTIKGAVTAGSIVMTVLLIIIGWGYAMAGSIATNTEAIRTMETRMAAIERTEQKIMDNQDKIVNNQDGIIKNQLELKVDINKLIRKLP